jgi:hypothetical protein
MQRYILHVCMLWAGEDAMLWSPAGKKNHWAPVIAQDVCMCMGSRSQRFFGNFDFFGWLRQPAGRMAQVSSVAGAVYIYIYVFNPETRSSYVRSTVHGLATSLVRLGPFGYPTSNIRVGLLVLYIAYVHFLARIAMYIASFEHHWLRLGPAMRLDIQHSCWFVGSLHRLCTFFVTHSHVHC